LADCPDCSIGTSKNTSLLEHDRNLRRILGCDRIRGSETGKCSADFPERREWHRLANAGENGIVEEININTAERPIDSSMSQCTSG
jgi:hypothetical protein